MSEVNEAKQISDHLNILIIEADSAEADKLMGLLKEQKLHPMIVSRVSSLGDGLEGLSKEQVDAILLNLMLPDSGGIHTLKKVIQLFPEVPVLIVNGPDDSALALHVFKEGAQDYLTKNEIGKRRLASAIVYATERAEYWKAHFNKLQSKTHTTKLAALGEISSDVSGDISGPVLKIGENLSQLKALLRGTSGNKEEALKLLDSTGDASNHLKALASELQDFAIEFGEEVQQALKMRQRYRILVVEDEDGVAYAIIRRLKKLGYELVDYAKNGREGYNMCVKSIKEGPRYSAVISDWKMPDWTGKDLLEKLRKNVYFENVPFMMVTAVDDRQQIKSLGTYRVNQYLLKPFTSQEFDKLVKRLLYHV